MKKFFLSFSTSFFTFLLFAQPAIQWQKALGGSDFEQAKSILQTSEGGYIVAGYTASNDGDVVGFQGLIDFWVVKLDPSGLVQWTKSLGGSDDDRAYAICQANDGGYIVVGFTQSNDGDVTGNHGDKDAWVVKLSGSGTLEWQKVLGGSGWDEAWTIEQTIDGGYIMAGRSNSNDGDVSGNLGGSLDFWVVKLSSTGAIEWQKTLGGSYEDAANSIRQTLDGGYIVAGYAKSNDGDVLGNNGNDDFWVVKLSSSGTIEWQNALGGTGADVARDIQETSDGFIVCGYTGSHNSGDVTGHQGLFDYWIVKLNSAGDLMWQKTFGGSNGDWGRSIIQTNDGMYVVTGETKSSDGDVIGNNGIQVIWTMKLNTMGDVIWQKSLGGTQGEGGAFIKQTDDNGYVLAGYAWSNNGDVSGNHGSSDFWVVKLSPESVSTNEAPNAQSAPLEIFPNPAQNSISINIPSAASALTVTISDLLGRKQLRQAIQNGGNLDVSSLPDGLYLLVATEPSGSAFSGKLIKNE